MKGFNLVVGIIITILWIISLINLVNGSEISDLSIGCGFVMGILFGLDRIFKGLLKE